MINLSQAAITEVSKEEEATLIKGKATFQSTLLAAFCILPEVSVDEFVYMVIESDIEKYFNQFGNVVDVAIMRDKHSGKSRGFAFVTFKEHTRSAV